jgi:hypothetical protein
MAVAKTPSSMNSFPVDTIPTGVAPAKRILRYLVFDHEYGEYLELTSEDEEFPLVLDFLGDFLKCPPGWRARPYRLRVRESRSMSCLSWG